MWNAMHWNITSSPRHALSSFRDRRAHPIYWPQAQGSRPVENMASYCCGQSILLKVQAVNYLSYTAISRKAVGKSARDHPERYFGWFCVHSSSSRKFERVAREAMDVCLRVLKKSSKSRFDGYSVRNSVLIISHITFRDCRVHIFFRQPFSK